MEQLYMIEIFIDSLSIIVRDDDTSTDTDKGFTLKVNFGPKREMFIKEDKLYDVQRNSEDVAYRDEEDGIRKWTRTFRVGKSFLFSSKPDTFLQTLANFPLEMELWTDDEIDPGEMVGKGSMVWDTGFFFKLKETLNAFTIHEPLALKQRAVLKLECCCRDIAQVNVIARLSALGQTITTEFQQLYEGFGDPDLFVFRSNKSPIMFECRKYDGEDKNFCMIGSLYESVTLDDPTVICKKRIEVCTNLKSCGTTTNEADESCHERKHMTIPKEYPIQTIRMGDICGPCGNPNCDLAHKIKGYIRTLEAYKKEAKDKNIGEKPSKAKTSRICGQCGCEDDSWHRDTCPSKTENPVCEGCGGIAHSGETCQDRVKKVCSISNPKIAYMTEIIYDNEQIQGMFGQDFIIYPCEVNNNNNNTQNPPRKACKCRTGRNIEVGNSDFDSKTVDNRTVRTMASNNSHSVYNVEAKAETSKKTNFCTDIPDEKDKDCKCKPPIPSPPCKTNNCECMIKAAEEDSRKMHRPFCPSYKHRANCPVTTMNDDEEEGDGEKDIEEPEPLPYGLPPIQLGPCPVLGRPCTVPDGFSRMYKTAVLPTQPASWSEAGKVCCSKEFERIKKALKEYVTEHKQDDFRCLNKFYVDTEKRCCDKEQRLLSLLGRSCCGAHKIQIQDEFKAKFEREASTKKNAETNNK